MLILKRNTGQRIVINGGIYVEVLPPDARDGRGTVKLGVTAPPEVIVDREEIHLQRQAHPETPNGRRK